MILLYIFLSLLFILGSVVFKWLIDRTYINEDKFRKICKITEDLKASKTMFIWKRRLYAAFMILCIVNAICFLLRISSFQK